MPTSDIVVLKGGFSVTLAAFQLCLDLEGRGCILRADGDVLNVRPAAALTTSDREQITINKPDLMRILRYSADDYVQ